jgi:hypothetical protein
MIMLKFKEWYFFFNLHLQLLYGVKQKIIRNEKGYHQYRPYDSNYLLIKDVTNTHFRYFFRLISKRATLYT